MLCNSYLHQSDLPGNLSWTRLMNIKWEKKRVSIEMTDLWKLFKLTNNTMRHFCVECIVDKINFIHRCQYPKTGWSVKIQWYLALISKQQEFAHIKSDTKLMILNIQVYMI